MKAQAPGRYLNAMAVTLLLAAHAFAQDAAPWNEVPADFDLPTNAVVHEAPPAFPPFGPPGNSPSPSTSFPAIPDDTTQIPPDTQGAVGPNHVMTMLNSQVRIQSRTGTTNSTVSLYNFWSSGGFFFNRVVDPRVLYDPYNQRWIATALADPLKG